MKRSRALPALLAALQLTLPGAAAWADALLDRTPVGPATTHFESQTTGSCPRLHPPDCALCQFLSAPRSAAYRVTFAFDLAASRIRPLAAPVLAGRAARLSHPESRAPPPLS